MNLDLTNAGNFNKSKDNPSLVIQIGNSATEANNHADCFIQLKKFKNQDIKLITPLSYGVPTYGEFVKQEAIRLFDRKFIPVENFVSREEYARQLEEIDIGIMYHNRSQAFGNCVMLLSLGKKLYLKNSNPLYHLFEKVGIKVFDAHQITEMSFEEFSTPLTDEEKKNNLDKVISLFSTKQRLEDLSRLLN